MLYEGSGSEDDSRRLKDEALDVLPFRFGENEGRPAGFAVATRRYGGSRRKIFAFYQGERAANTFDANDLTRFNESPRGSTLRCVFGHDDSFWLNGPPLS